LSGFSPLLIPVQWVNDSKRGGFHVSDSDDIKPEVAVLEIRLVTDSHLPWVGYGDGLYHFVSSLIGMNLPHIP
jgi:hypothetical protein